MAKSQKKTTKVETPEVVDSINAYARGILDIEIPTALRDRFNPQLAKVIARLEKIATNLTKAIALEATKDEREAKRKERDEKRIEKLTKQLEAGTKKLKELKNKK